MHTLTCTPSHAHREEHAEVRDLYLKAAQMSPEQVDPDIQVYVHVCASHTSVYVCMQVLCIRD